MTRRYACAVCDGLMPEDKASTLTISLKAPAVAGIPPMPLNLTADLCSQECCAVYLREHALRELMKQFSRHQAITGKQTRERLLNPVDADRCSECAMSRALHESNDLRACRSFK